jgi:hypothetical protein
MTNLVDAAKKNWKPTAGVAGGGTVIAMLTAVLVGIYTNNQKRDELHKEHDRRITKVEEAVSNAIENIAGPALIQIEKNQVAIKEVLDAIHRHEISGPHPEAVVELRHLREAMTTNEREHAVIMSKMDGLSTVANKILGKLEK